MSSSRPELKILTFIKSRVGAAIAALIVTGLIGTIDFLTGCELIIFAFYLLPVCWITLRIGRRAGIALALLCSILSISGDLLTAFPYSHPSFFYWNALMLLAMLLPTVFLLSAFQRSQIHLEETVAIRTYALKMEIEKRKKAEAAKIQSERFAMVGKMAAQVAHEVRNPLGAIVLTLDLVENELDKIATTTNYPVVEGTELLSALRDEVKRIDRVIGDYLNLARPRPAALEVLEMNDLIRRKLAFIRGVFTETGVECKTSLSGELLPVRADGDKLWQAILNLIRNSLEAMPDGGTLTVETKCEGPAATIQLTDTGCGMSAEQQEHIYTPFVTSKATGTGLGLALVHEIVTEHGGEIQCSSAAGKGTTFTISLPLHKETQTVGQPG